MAGRPRVADPWSDRAGRRRHHAGHRAPRAPAAALQRVAGAGARPTSLVVDTALGLRPLRGSSSASSTAPLLAVATHAHGDHVGGLHEFDRRAVHAAEADAVAEAGLDDARHRLLRPRRSPAPTSTPATTSPTLLVDAAPGRRASTRRVVEIAPAPATRVLHDGDVIDLGDRRFEVLHLPGPLAGQHRAVGGRHRRAVLRRRGLRRAAARRARRLRHRRPT